MIVKKLLNHVEVQLSSQGLDGTEELKRVEIPGLANTFDPRCGTRSVRKNCKAYLVALKLESRSIMQWLKAFNLCRAHHCASFSSGGSVPMSYPREKSMKKSSDTTGRPTIVIAASWNP